MYKNATRSIFPDSEQSFDGSPENLQIFLYYLRIRADDYGWNDNGCLDIELDPGSADSDITNLLENYANISVEQVKTYSQSYINTECRAAQDSHMLHQAIHNSINAKLTNKIRNKSKDYTIKNVVPGELFLRVIIREVYTDTNATLAKIHRQLQSLPNYMQTIKNDIEKFNLYVEDIQAQLAARGAQSSELITHLFTAYSSVRDQVFVCYIESKQNEFDEGKNVKAEDLMAAALTKFQTRKDAGMWEALSDEQEQLVSLKTDLVQLKNQNKQLKKAKSKPKPTPRAPVPTINSNNAGTDNAGTNNPRTTYKIPEWKKTPPTDEEKAAGSKKKVKNNWYYWCPIHKRWTFHKPEDCKGLNYNPRSANNQPNANSTTSMNVQETVVAPYCQPVQYEE